MRKTILILLLWIGMLPVLGQSIADIYTLDQADFEEILDGLDSVGYEKNFHILVDNGVPDHTEGSIIHIWTSDRLGETMFEEAGIHICDFFSFRFSHVFVYRFEECHFYVQPKFLVESSNSSSYQYLKESPFYDESGQYQSFFVRVINGEPTLEKLEIVQDSSFVGELQEIFEN